MSQESLIKHYVASEQKGALGSDAEKKTNTRKLQSLVCLKGELKIPTRRKMKIRKNVKASFFFNLPIFLFPHII